MKKSVKVSAKYKENKPVGQKTIEKECILGKIQWRKIAYGVRYNGDKVRKV